MHQSKGDGRNKEVYYNSVCGVCGGDNRNFKYVFRKQIRRFILEHSVKTGNCFFLLLFLLFALKEKLNLCLGFVEEEEALCESSGGCWGGWWAYKVRQFDTRDQDSNPDVYKWFAVGNKSTLVNVGGGAGGKLSHN